MKNTKILVGAFFGIVIGLAIGAGTYSVMVDSTNKIVSPTSSLEVPGYLLVDGRLTNFSGLSVISNASSSTFMFICPRTNGDIASIEGDGWNTSSNKTKYANINFGHTNDVGYIDFFVKNTSSASPQRVMRLTTNGPSGAIQFPLGAQNNYVWTSDAQGNGSWQASGESGSQTPWTQDIDGNNKALGNVSSVTAVSVEVGTLSIVGGPGSISGDVNASGAWTFSSTISAGANVANFSFDATALTLGSSFSAPSQRSILELTMSFTDAVGGSPAFKIERAQTGGTNIIQPLILGVTGTTTNFYTFRLQPGVTCKISNTSGTGASVAIVSSVLVEE